MSPAPFSPSPPEGTLLWPLPLAAGALPLVAVVTAWTLSVQEQLIPPCNPFVDGCVSISRAARYGLGNHLFRAVVLPAAVLQCLTWWLAARWLLRLGALAPPRARALAAVGVAAGLFLILYGTFLGTEGNVYRWARRYGIVFYFGFTCIGMLLVAGATRAEGWSAPQRLRRLLLALVYALPALGLANALAPLALASETPRDVVQNVTEWWGGAIFSAFFFLLARLWAVTGFRASLHLAPFDRNR